MYILYLCLCVWHWLILKIAVFDIFAFLQTNAALYCNYFSNRLLFTTEDSLYCTDYGRILILREVKGDPFRTVWGENGKICRRQSQDRRNFVSCSLYDVKQASLQLPRRRRNVLERLRRSFRKAEIETIIIIMSC